MRLRLSDTMPLASYMAQLGPVLKAPGHQVIGPPVNTQEWSHSGGRISSMYSSSVRVSMMANPGHGDVNTIRQRSNGSGRRRVGSSWPVVPASRVRSATRPPSGLPP
jgi:hypothetical protein